MPAACFKNVALRALVTCTGPVTRSLDDESALFADAPEQIDRIKRFVGIQTRDVAPPGVTTLDLGEAAARRLLLGTGVSPETLDAVVFVTQTPDHTQPSNANLLHGRLSLAKKTAAFDINQGCSGWVYGAYVAASMITAGGCSRVLLMAGDTVTQTLHPRDRSVIPLFSDACAAALLESSTDAAPWWFDLHSDGTGHDAIKIPVGGHRRPKGPDTSGEISDSEGNVRTSEHLAMNGLEVLNFTLREEPAAVRNLMTLANLTESDVDAFVFHQANHFILSNLAKRLKLPMDKVPTGTLLRFGNQSSASIPCCMTHDLGQRLRTSTLRILCSGFGVGLSWASCATTVGPMACCECFQYTSHKNGHSQ